MNLMRASSIQAKLLQAALLTGLLALVFVVGATLIYDKTTFQPQLLAGLRSRAEILRVNLYAPLIFDDADTANQTLATLKATKDIDFAAIYKVDGTLFARYASADEDEAEADYTPLKEPPEETYRFSNDRVFLVVPIMHNDSHVGFLELNRTLPSLAERLPQYALMVSSIIGSIIITIIFLTLAVRYYITKPILSLAEFTQRFSPNGKSEVRFQSNRRDEIGRLEQAINQMLDAVTQRETALRDSEARLNQFLDELPLGIYIVDHRGHPAYANRKSYEILGRGMVKALPEDVIKIFRVYKADTNQLYPVDQAPMFRSLRGETATVDDMEIHRDDKVIPLEVSSSPVYSADGKLAYSITAFWDITTRKKAEAEILLLNTKLEQRVKERTAELSAAVKELETFCYTVSHDLRTPLRAMDGYARILMEDAKDIDSEAATNYLRRICERTQFMAQLLDDLLQFARSSRIALIKQPVKPIDIVTTIRTQYVDDPVFARARFIIGDLPPCQADPALLAQVYANLINNAVKYSSHGEQPTIEIGSQQHTGKCVYFIRDNGIGFDMKYADKLFGVFHRLHNQKEYSGTGVGLAIVERIIHRHGGRIWAEAAPGKGATFFFTLG